MSLNQFQDKLDNQWSTNGGCEKLPAADAGPRQPVQVERSLLEGILNFMNRRFDGDRLLKHQAHFIGELHRVLDPPVPQEAAPKTCLKCGKPMADTQVRCLFCDAYEPAPDTKWDDEMPRDNRFHDPLSPATAPDEAMRVARKFCEEAFTEHNPTLVETWRNRLAEMIREAGSREPDGWAHRYHNCIRFNQGQEVNGEKPSEAVPYWLGTLRQAGSEKRADWFPIERVQP